MVKIQIPPSIKVLTHTYTIKFGVKELASTGCSGLTRHLYQEIILENTATPPTELNQIFLHEYIHILERRFCVKLDDADVERLSEGLAVLLFDTLGLEFDWSLVDKVEG